MARTGTALRSGLDDVSHAFGLDPDGGLARGAPARAEPAAKSAVAIASIRTAIRTRVIAMERTRTSAIRKWFRALADRSVSALVDPWEPVSAPRIFDNPCSTSLPLGIGISGCMVSDAP
jgi:hypothetical protein